MIMNGEQVSNWKKAIVAREGTTAASWSLKEISVKVPGIPAKIRTQDLLTIKCV
jgi:hypothetical protein